MSIPIAQTSVFVWHIKNPTLIIIFLGGGGGLPTEFDWWYPANNVSLMLGHRLRRWTGI